MYKRLLFLVLVAPVTVFAQSSFDLVYTTLSTKCSNAACHSATSADALKFDGTSADVYASIVGQTPATAAAVTRGEKLVWTSQPYQSYLLKKAASWLDADLALPANEADSFHVNCSLTNQEGEYIRQWIQNGAQFAGTHFDQSAVDAYYNDTTAARAVFYPKPPVAQGEYQVRFGPIFVPGTSGKNEVEYCLKHEIDFPFDVEVVSNGGAMNNQSHHFLLFKFDDSTSAAAMPDSMRRIQLLAGNSSFDGNKKLVSAWQTNATYDLPTQTAFFWSGKTWLDLNYHMKNYTSPGASGVQPFDFYLNVRAVEHLPTSNTIEMKTKLGNNIQFALLPHSPASFDYADDDNGTNETRYLWMISSHTHKFGTSYNIFTYDRTASGHIGDTIYQGNYNYLTSSDNGYYDWEHPPVEFFAPQRPINFATSGVIVRTGWNNTSGGLIHFGYTTADEMQLYYYMYTTRLAGTTAVNNASAKAFSFSVYPNPMSDMGTISYTLETPATVRASIVDITGSEVATLKEEKNQAGTYSMDMGTQTLAKGIYFARLNVDGSNYTRKFVVQ